jgi:hypothetical protein
MPDVDPDEGWPYSDIDEPYDESYGYLILCVNDDGVLTLCDEETDD